MSLQTAFLYCVSLPFAAFPLLCFSAFRSPTESIATPQEWDAGPGRPRVEMHSPPRGVLVRSMHPHYAS